MKQELPYGLYDALLDEELQEILLRNPDLRSVLSKIDSDEQPARYAAFLAKIVEQVLREQSDPYARLAICNRLIEVVSSEGGAAHFPNRRLVQAQKPVLLEITPPEYSKPGVPRPRTPVTQSSLFTGSPLEPQLVHELQEEMRSADSLDILISFIKWSGLRLLIPGFEDLRGRGIPVRLITTSYMGASDAPAVEWLAKMPNVKVRVSYDTGRTRLHAKAYHFFRNSGFSTAYIGSANMSQAAMTSGLEWNLKVTAQDMPHILEKFYAEFETYWNSREFISFDPGNPYHFREAISHARTPYTGSTIPFFDLRPHPFQERILDQLSVEREVHGHSRNLVIAATGTGKTVVAAFDFKRFFEEHRRLARLLFVAHRREILEQAQGTFRNVLRIADFGELLVGPREASRIDHLFCSVDMLASRQLWKQTGPNFYDFIIVDEVHHGPSNSYRAIFDQFSPKILLGLTATPERMDGKSVAADFGNRFAAEIRLPEALEEKLLCPFHYFGVADPVSLNADTFWKSGKYDLKELEKVYTGGHALALKRLDTILVALLRYEPDLSRVKGIGFCVSIRHAEYMSEMFNQRGISSGVIVGETGNEIRTSLLEDFRNGKLSFLFTRDVFNEGLDVPEVNTVLFLRPTESLTVFLQQLGRGLRHALDKDCLTVLDFVGQANRRYRIDTKLKALLPKHRFAIDREVELDFPHLPPGCSIQLDRIAREYVLENIRENLRNLAVQIPERVQTFENETGQHLSFGNFVNYHDYEPEILLARESWTGWKAKAHLAPLPNDPDISHLRPSLIRVASIKGPREIERLKRVVRSLQETDIDEALIESADKGVEVHYRLWGRAGKDLGIETVRDSLSRVAENRAVLSDLGEVLDWAQDQSRVSGLITELPFQCSLELHGQYGSADIKAALGMATLETAGPTGVGVLYFAKTMSYALLVTFQKTEREFSPSTMYADYPISRELLHWESQSNTSQNSNTGQNLIHHKDLGCTILIFARSTKKRNGIATPFTYLGPGDRVSFENERPIKMVWKLRYPMPVDMFEENRRGG